MSDYISRAAAIDAIEHRLDEPAYQHTGEDWYVGMNSAESVLNDLPSAQPERINAVWLDSKEDWRKTLFRCSECRFASSNLYKYCPNCGSKMNYGINPIR